MNKNIRGILGISLTLFLTGCLLDAATPAQKRGKQTRRPAGQAEKMFEVQTISQQAGECGEIGAPCAIVNIRIPTITSGTNESARDAINAGIGKAMSSGGGGEKGPQTPEVLAYDFLSEYERTRAQDPEYRVKWTLDKNFSVVRNDGRVLSMAFTERRNAGDGIAETLTFVNFRLETGATLQLSDLFVEGYDLKLLPLAETKFRTLKRMKPGKSLSEAGFTFDGDRFQLTDNFSITSTGLRFHWNKNDISSGPNGVTDLVFDWKSISELLKPEGMALLGIVPKTTAAKP